jgi:endonuclease-3
MSAIFFYGFDDFLLEIFRHLFGQLVNVQVFNCDILDTHICGNHELQEVGRKTASVVLNAAFGQSTIAVDTHVFRVANRTGLAPGKTPLEVEHKLEACVPKAYARHAHHWLILHGRYVCKARRPDCALCVVADLCAYPAKTTVPA